MNVPLVDLRGQHQEVRDEVEVGWAAVLDKAAFVLGEAVSAFEAEFAEYSGVAHTVGVANGTDALELALRAAGIGPGDEVVVPANSFIASALAVARIGAVPVFVDVDRRTQLIDVAQTEARIGPNTRAVMPVHLFGQMAPMEALADIAGDRVVLIEDAAQAQGARRNGKGAGSFGLVAGTSFYPGKNLGAYGDAGAVLTNDGEIAGRVRALRNYGSEVKYHHPETGFNSRLDTLQAVVLSAKLKRLEAWNEARRRAADRYEALLAGAERVELPATLEGNDHVWHLYVVRVPQRDEVLRRLNEAGVGAGIHYPVPIHLQGAFSGFGGTEGAFPVAERAAQEILSLPMHPHLSEAQQEYVVETLLSALP